MPCVLIFFVNINVYVHTDRVVVKILVWNTAFKASNVPDDQYLKSNRSEAALWLG